MEFGLLKLQTVFNKAKDSDQRKQEAQSRSQLASQVPSDFEESKLYLEPTTPQIHGRKQNVSTLDKRPVISHISENGEPGTSTKNKSNSVSPTEDRGKLKSSNSPQRSVVFERVRKDSDRALLFKSFKVQRDNQTIIIPSQDTTPKDANTTKGQQSATVKHDFTTDFGKPNLIIIKNANEGKSDHNSGNY